MRRILLVLTILPLLAPLCPKRIPKEVKEAEKNLRMVKEYEKFAPVEVEIAMELWDKINHNIKRRDYEKAETLAFALKDVLDRAAIKGAVFTSPEVKEEEEELREELEKFKRKKSMEELGRSIVEVKAIGDKAAEKEKVFEELKSALATLAGMEADENKYEEAKLLSDIVGILSELKEMIESYEEAERAKHEAERRRLMDIIATIKDEKERERIEREIAEAEKEAERAARFRIEKELERLRLEKEAEKLAKQKEELEKLRERALREQAEEKMRKLEEQIAILTEKTKSVEEERSRMREEVEKVLRAEFEEERMKLEKEIEALKKKLKKAESGLERKKLEEEIRALKEKLKRAEPVVRIERPTGFEALIAMGVKEEEIVGTGAFGYGFKLSFMGDVYFEFDSAKIRKDMLGVIKKNAEWLRRYPVKVVLEGYASAEGTYEYNLNLALRRAQAVKEVLIREGVPTSRIVVSSLGEMFSKKDKRDRRATFIVVP